jgi:hypothetical protein
MRKIIFVGSPEGSSEESLARIDEAIAQIREKADALRDALAEDRRDEVLTALKAVAYTLENSRIWDGQRWHYSPLHPMIFVPALEKALAAIAKAEGRK